MYDDDDNVDIYGSQCWWLHNVQCLFHDLHGDHGDLLHDALLHDDGHHHHAFFHLNMKTTMMMMMMMNVMIMPNSMMMVSSTALPCHIYVTCHKI